MTTNETVPEKLVRGVFAAVGTPRRADGSLDERSLARSIEFLLERGIRGLALNGATGEFCLTTPAELARMLAVAERIAAGRAALLCGIGSAGLRGCVENGRIAEGGGASGLLLPMPYFFPYAQDDLEAFCREAAAQLSLPILLYNLPQFASGLEPVTALKLISECPNIVGIKDSSGSLDVLRLLTASAPQCCRVVGNDSALAEALRERVCDGVISGVAFALPELLVSIYGAGRRPDSEEFQEAARTLSEFLGAIAPFPVPWALKLVAEARGIAPASFSQPLSPRRMAQARELKEWFKAWQPALATAAS